MVLAHEDPTDADLHPYWYARIVGIFHTHVLYTDPDSRKIHGPNKVEFLWVRWFGRDLGYRAGWAAKRLYRVGFMPDSPDGPEAFGFLDPKDVIRGTHLIPAFTYGRTKDLLAPSLVRQPNENDEDWLYYYVNMYVPFLSPLKILYHPCFRFVDRDVVMRYTGGGIGHKGICDRSLDHQTDNISEESDEDDLGEGGYRGDGDVGTMDDAMDVGRDGGSETSEEEGDYGYNHDEDSEGDEGEGDGGELGPEDGEEKWSDPEDDLYGYAAL